MAGHERAQLNQMCRWDIPADAMIRDYLSLVRQQPAFLLFGLLMTCLSSFGQTFYIGLFSGDIRANLSLGHGDFGLLYSLATLASGFALLWSGRLVDYLELRWITFLTVLLFGLSVLAMGWIASPLMLFPVLFLLRLVGQGMMGHIAVTAMGRYFAASRGRAISVAALGFPLGEAVFPAVTVALMTFFDWQTIWIVAGIMLLLAGLPFLLTLLRGHSRRHRVWQLRQERSRRPSSKGEQNQWQLSQVLKDARFWGLLPVMLSPPFFVTGFFFHQVALIESKQWQLEWLAASFVVFAATQTAGLILAGYLVDRTNAGRLLSIYLLPMGLGLGVICLMEANFWMVLYMGLMGLTAGASATIVGAIWAELYGTRYLGAIRSVYTACMIFSTAASPWLMGMLMDRSVNIESIAGVSFLWLFAISAVVAITGHMRRGVKHQKP